MTQLQIKAGDFAVLRDGSVVGPLEAGNDVPDWIAHDVIENRWAPVWLSNGVADFFGDGTDFQQFDILAAFPTREEALAYAPPLPVTALPGEVDWKARAEAAEAGLHRIDEMLMAGQGDDDGPQIMPDFGEGDSIEAKVEACLHLLERRRDVMVAAEARGMERAAAIAQEIAEAARKAANQDKLGSRTRNDMMERCWGAEDAARAILAAAKGARP